MNDTQGVLLRYRGGEVYALPTADRHARITGSRAAARRARVSTAGSVARRIDPRAIPWDRTTTRGFDLMGLDVPRCR